MLEAAQLLVRLQNTFMLVMVGYFLTACDRAPETNVSRQSVNSPETKQTLKLSPSQLSAIKLQKVESSPFHVEKKGVGNIDFDNKLYFDNNLAIQVFPPRVGKITKNLAELGDQVQKGQALYAIAVSNAIELDVGSPISGQVTSVNASPGLQVEPGKAPAPYAVADVSTKWMVGSIAESDSSLFRVGQPVEIKVMAQADRVFEGKIIKLYPTVDANTHRLMIRAEVADPDNDLRSGMLAEFVVRVEQTSEALSVLASCVVREADGTMTVWVTADRRHFSQQIVKTGLREDDRVQVLEGIERGDLVVSEGAVFLSNMLQAPPSD